ncbi:SNF2 family N-terminal domain-containing protein [Cantharellus anzutake]|uniref:SNF2 family N-terminal domain-containing protein n=1 Tax=Cantharellus anzutake TaxID=1750568 RepID=UPI0019032223|nr:SNF2 family N-terminal domain-containing protein [Cantharellus anzutake]KAF8336587.1 SNF2 family N-terminal domain-containing protein [Cantharellus anzutake]
MYLTQNGPKPLFSSGPVKALGGNPHPEPATLTAQLEDGEAYNIDSVPEVYEFSKSTEDASREMREFLSGAIGALNLDDVDPTEARVEGFREGITLLPHQVQGRVWMRERETGKKLGGILADMGLGKTIQTVTRILDGKPSGSDLAKAKNLYTKATLVVAPVSVMPQWASEIEKMAPGLRVIQHHGPKRTADPKVFGTVDVVITTYTTLASEHTKYAGTTESGKKKALREESDDSSDDSVIEESIRAKAKSSTKAKKGPLCALFETGFWRVVLDEAQNIKNRSTKAAKACFDLRGKYRWVLTGTPIQNSVEELFPFFHFLRIRPINNWDTFNARIAKPVKAGKTVNAMKRLHVVLSATMLRRTKNQTIEGKPLLVLPERTVEVVTCEFDPDERAFYEMLSERAANRLADIEAGGNISGKSYTQVLVLLLRLRQACNHPSLINKDHRKDAAAIESKPERKTEEEEESKEVDELADLFGAVDLAGGKECVVCQVSLPKSHESNYCDECAKTVVKVANRKSVSRRVGGRGAGSGSGADVVGDELDLLPSTKINKVLELLDQILARTSGKLDEDGKKIPPQKTIIFSQFTSMLDLIEPFLRNAGIRYCRYDGSMPPAKREEALNQIRNNKATRVILISFKAGGTGLNLTACNNVILVDLWWNPALEDQAFDRAHRLGQKKPVSIYKLTVRDTVEQRILQLQEKKRALAAAALSGGKLGKGGLKLEELLDLFDRADLD